MGNVTGKFLKVHDTVIICIIWDDHHDRVNRYKYKTVETVTYRSKNRVKTSIYNIYLPEPNNPNGEAFLVRHKENPFLSIFFDHVMDRNIN